MGQLIRDEAVAVGTTVVKAAESITNGQRHLITFVNTSGTNQVITLFLNNSQGSAGAGIVLYPRQPYAESIDNRFTPSNLPWYAVADAVGGTLAVHEIIESV